jgi:hypothetical protein
MLSKKEKEYYKNKIKSHPGYFVDKVARRDAAKRNASPPWLTAEHKDQIASFYNLASKMTEITGVPHHVDHIDPIQGANFCGLHVPWNLQVLTSQENTSKSNRENRKIIYLLCGQSGVGKTTLLNSFAEDFSALHYDKIRDSELECIIDSSSGVVVLDIAIKISTIIKRYSHKYFIRPIFMVEPVEIVKDRVEGRGGKTSNLLKRYNRIVSLSNKYAYYSGNTEEVRQFLNELKKTTTD